MEDEFTQLQAILAGLPMHAVPSSSSRSCGPEAWMQCGGKRRPGPCQEANEKSPSAAHRVEAMLAAVAADYPAHEEVLRRLSVEAASLDLVCFADHAAAQLFVAVRGTHRNMNLLTTPDDLRSNMHIILGCGPARAEPALSEYRALRRRFPHYDAFGCGHSLGGAVILHVAKAVEKEAEFAFRRVDVFNTATSPLPVATPAPLAATELHVHRVTGDWASWGLRFYDPGSGKVHTRNAKTSIPDPHSLRHFLPDKDAEADSEASTATSSTDRQALMDTMDAQAPVAPAAVRPMSWEAAFMNFASCVGMHRKRLLPLPQRQTASESELERQKQSSVDATLNIDQVGTETRSSQGPA
ncbi:unnamed protein product [Symbiodinium natans]|uniref:Fungal lipase-like domain-containing protein n=1 Tax=Symbiodinium natans TaxID=878477 RepID=A0A812HFE2_9DINO|nr:unnamed protein product [Symbiodinium natans]